MTVTAYIALGSNLGNPEQQLARAVRALSLLAKSRLLIVSPWYRSKPLGPADQPDYVNGVAALETGLPPLELLDQLQSIEQDHGRARTRRWGPRTLDLDILLYGMEVINRPRLITPHPEMQHRNFVLQPLYDIAPDLKMPDGTALEQLLENAGTEGIVRLLNNPRSAGGDTKQAG